MSPRSEGLVNQPRGVVLLSSLGSNRMGRCVMLPLTSNGLNGQAARDDAHPLARMTSTIRQPGGPGASMGKLPDPWLCVPASRRVCLFEVEPHEFGLMCSTSMRFVRDTIGSLSRRPCIGSSSLTTRGDPRSCRILATTVVTCGLDSTRDEFGSGGSTGARLIDDLGLVDRFDRLESSQPAGFEGRPCPRSASGTRELYLSLGVGRRPPSCEPVRRFSSSRPF
jgi:hypothetical protein